MSEPPAPDEQNEPPPPTSAAQLTVAVTGASGLVGRHLVEALVRQGHRARPLVRRAPRAPEGIAWDPQRGTIDAEQLAGIDGVVHLAGEPGRAGRKQWVSWIHLPDLLRAILHILAVDSLSGPVNATSPRPVTNADFARALGAALHRPAVVRAPAFALKLAMGQMAEETLLASA